MVVGACVAADGSVAITCRDHGGWATPSFRKFNVRSQIEEGGTDYYWTTGVPATRRDGRGRAEEAGDCRAGQGRVSGRHEAERAINETAVVQSRTGLRIIP